MNCQMCIRGKPEWVCIDPKQHTFVDVDSGDVSKRRVNYFVCGRCKEQTERYNSQGRWSRDLRYIPVEDKDKADA